MINLSLDGVRLGLELRSRFFLLVAAISRFRLLLLLLPFVNFSTAERRLRSVADMTYLRQVICKSVAIICAFACRTPRSRANGFRLRIRRWSHVNMRYSTTCDIVVGKG